MLLQHLLLALLLPQHLQVVLPVAWCGTPSGNAAAACENTDSTCRMYQPRLRLGEVKSQ
jgi:hypothetical protein